MKILFSTLLILSSLFSQTTMCYKKNISSDTINKNIKLNGKECKGKLSLNDMEKTGWLLRDKKIIKKENSFTHLYILNQNDNFIVPLTTKKTSLGLQKYKIETHKDNSVKIAEGDLKIGQSGVIIRKLGQNSIILSYASVSKSNEKFSLIELLDDDILFQDAIPQANLSVKDDDTFILNHLYNSSLLVVPNFDVKREIKKLYPKQKFISEDFFASHLKLIDTPLPKKNDIRDFAKAQELGTIFIVIKNKLFIIDTLSFKVIDTININADTSKKHVPFFSKINEIKKGFWNFGDSKIENYDEYYSKLLELK